MITIVQTGMCQGCEYADLELHRIDINFGKKKWYLSCRHRDACDWIESVTIDRLRRCDEKEK